MQGKMQKGSKKRASAPNFVSTSQLVLGGFETPFSQQLRRTNRWVVLAGKIPWDEVCNIYTKQIGVSHTGRPPISRRVVIGSLICLLYTSDAADDLLCVALGGRR